VNKIPRNASKYPCINILSHSYKFRRIRGAILREFSMSLLNCCPMSCNIPPHTRSQSGSYLRTGHRGPGPGRQISRGGILNNRDWSTVCGKKGCPRERSLREIYTENNVGTEFCRYDATGARRRWGWIRTNKGGGAQNFLGPRGVKYLNTGLCAPDDYNTESYK
jgi:hypothetical protein